MRRIFTGVLLVATALLFGGCSIGGGDTTPLDYSSPTIGTLKYVPAGTFQSDSDPGHTSTVSAFRMSEYEIGRMQFYLVMGADPSQIAYSSGINDPVQMANWYHAIAFCNKLSIAEGLTPVYSVIDIDDWEALTYADIPDYPVWNWNEAAADWDADGYRLPTEMEWMWAAMGADTADPGAINTTGYSKAFAGSTGTNSIDDYAWYSSNSGGTTHPSGGKSPNELDLYDMSGNVYEWCWDKPSVFTFLRIDRGGFFNASDVFCAVGYRSSHDGGIGDVSIGFRVVRP